MMPPLRSVGPSVEFDGPAGAPAYFAPDSVHWRVYKTPAAVNYLWLRPAKRVRGLACASQTPPIDPVGAV
jgi:hypothetical protein